MHTEALRIERPTLRAYWGRFAWLSFFVLMTLGWPFAPDRQPAALWMLLLIDVVMVLLIYLPHSSNRYEISRKGIRSQVGLIARSTSDIEVRDIRNVQVRQSVVGRLLDYGDVLISTSGQSGFEVALRDLRGPIEVADMIRKLRRA